MKLLSLFATFMIGTSLLLHSQGYSYKGINFEKGLTWHQIKQKAQTQKKYIFVECFATWCGPCKEMDRTVYVDDYIGSLVNESFISIKVQMDTSETDDYNTQILYSVARQFEKKYKITGLPTYLFFSPSGEIVHKDMGGKAPKEFIEVIRDATDPQRQIFSLLNNFHIGKMNFESLPKLADKLKTLGEDSLALEIARRYMHEYLDRLSEDSFFQKNNLEFLKKHAKIVSSKDRIFKAYLDRPAIVDEILETPNYSNSQINAVIYREEILPNINKNTKSGKDINWNKIYKSIEVKYNIEYAVNLTLFAKQNWYYNQKKWQPYLSCLMELWKARREDFNKYGWVYLNHIAWTTCVHSTDKMQLRAALDWINMAIPMVTEPSIPMLDTKAMILYKIGLATEAIAIEKKVVELSETAYSGTDKKVAIDYYNDIINKMKKGETIKLAD